MVAGGDLQMLGMDAVFIESSDELKRRGGGELFDAAGIPRDEEEGRLRKSGLEFFQRMVAV
jgi:hypothetical protein